MSSEVLVLALTALIFVSAVLQSVSGFGFALLSAPLLAASLGGPLAVSTVLITGTACDLAILGLRASLPRPAGRDVATLALWSVPGMLAGAWLLAALPTRWLQAFVACVVILAVAVRLRSYTGVPAVASPRWAWSAGFTSGALSTSTSLAGPPAVFYLTHRGLTPHVMRDTLVTLSLVRLPLSIAALAAAGVWEVSSHWPGLIVAALVGQFLGTQVFHRFAATRYELVVMTLLAVSGVAALGTAAA